MKDYFEDDRPVNYDKYLNMSEEELDAEIERLELEARVQKEQSSLKIAL